MKLKNTTIFAVLLLAVILLPVNARAAEGSCGENLSWVLDSTGTLTISGSGQMEDYSSASAPWNSYKNSVKTVILEEGVTAVGTSAFEGCSNLQAVTVAATVTQIRDYAFFGCTSLSGVYIAELAAWCGIEFGDYSSSPMYYAKALYLDGQPVSGAVEIPEGVTDIPIYAFYHCSGITSVVLPDSVEHLGSYSFAYCTGLEKALLGAGLSRIGSSAFAYCTGLRQLETGVAMTQIDDYAFRGCSSLTAVHLPENLEKLGHRTFAECSALEQVIFPDNLKQIGTYGFHGCEALRGAVLPAGLTAIGDYTFYGCKQMTALSIPDTVTVIGKYAFYSCSALSALTIPEQVTSIGSHAFHNCTGLTSLRFNAVCMEDLSSSNYVFYKAGQGGDGIRLTVGAEVQRLPAYLFFPYSSATYGPKLVNAEFAEGSACTEIGKYAFANCKSLAALQFKDAAPAIGINAFYNMRAVIYYPQWEQSWTAAADQSYGGSIVWLAYSALVEAADGVLYPSVAAAVESKTEYIKLHMDAVADTVLTGDLYVDLNGFKLSGTIQTGDYKLFGVDTATDDYTAARAGSMDCTDGQGAKLIPQAHCKYQSKRYLAIESEEGYGFHRFYMGITHMTLKPEMEGVGYKAVFMGSEQVREQLDSYGYSLQLGSFTPRIFTKPEDMLVSGQTVTLRIDHYDVERFGEAALEACMVLQLKNGTVIQSSSCTMTLRGFLEKLNQNAAALEQSQLTAVAAFIKKYAIISSWDVDNLL